MESEAETSNETVDAFSSHSLQHGFATWAKAAGRELKSLMEYVSWRDEKAAMRYIETVSPFEHAMAQIPTDGDCLGHPRLEDSTNLKR